ncbi:MAG: tetratricopeptide repeat protein [Verrucomicrobiota bacterium]
MDEPTPFPRPFVSRVLPWLLAGAALALYLATLNRWVSVASLPVVAQAAGWDGQLPYLHPLLYLVTRPLRLVGEAQVPLAANILTALLAALSLGLLARCVALLPHDRSREQRIRGHLEGSLLDIPLAWMPPCLAVALVGLQRTFWEQATAMTGEMVHLALFAACIWCLLEYRRHHDERRLVAYAFLQGLGMATNWGMIGFLPLFGIAVVWMAGWSLWNLRLLGRCLLAGLAGLSLFLLIPAIGQGTGGLPDSFGGALWELLKVQKSLLLGIPKGRFLMLAPVMLLPVVAVGIQWGAIRGSSLERIASTIFLTLLQLAWLGSALWMAFDPAFSPRTLITESPENGALPLLSFQFVAALSVGYFTGYYLLLGTATPRKEWDRPAGLLALAQKLGAWLVMIATAALPAALAWRNLPALRAENGPLLGDVARQIAATLPSRPALVVSDDDFAQALLYAELQRDRTRPRHVLFSTRLAPQADYRRQLAERHGQDWPLLRVLATNQFNIAGYFLALVQPAVTNQAAFYLNPAMNFVTEISHLAPAGPIFSLEAYQPGQIAPPPLSSSRVEATRRFWEGVAPVLERARTAGRAGSASATAAARFWARAANTHGVLLQRGGDFPTAARLFQLALDLGPDPAVARANLGVNRALAQGQRPPADLRKPLETLPLGNLVTEEGFIDEPLTLIELGQGLLRLTEPLARAAAIAHARALELLPDNLEAALGFAEACLAAREPDLTLKHLAGARRRATRPTEAQTARLTRLEASAHLAKGDLPAGERLLKTALEKYPQDIKTLDLLTGFYVQAGQATNALPYIRRLVQLSPGDEEALERQGYVQMMASLPLEALQSFEEVLRRRPEQASARLNRATVYLILNRLDDARSDYEWLLRRTPEAGQPRVGLAEVAARKGEKAEAVRQLEKALGTVVPGTELHSQIQQRLEELKKG